jgi:formylglycine-generating enzyme required for sulfatase activity
MKTPAALIAFTIVLLALPALTGSQSSRGLVPVTIADSQGKEVTRYARSYALLIGAGAYTAGWPMLSGAVADIQRLKPVLEAQGFQCRLVENPTGDQLKRAYEDFINRYGLDPDTRLLLYFAGHGHTVRMDYGEDMGYIVPIDAPNPNRNPKEFLQKALDMQMVEVYARRIQSRHALFIFDSCFSGSLFAMSRAIPENISFKTANPVRQFITSGSADEQVPDRSVFAGQLIAALKGEGDRNGDGYVTGSELGEFLQEKVINYSRNAQHPQYGKIRNPSLDKGDFVFALPSAPSAPTAPKVKPPSGPELSVEDLKKKTVESEQIKTAWVTRLGKMKSSFEDAKQFDARESAAPADKEEFWRRFIDAYGEDNPYSDEDNAMLAEANSRRANWGKVKQQFKPTPAEKPAPTSETITGIRMVRIPGGTFEMGSTDGDKDEIPVHTVTLSAFEMSATEITQGQYKAVMGKNPSHFTGDDNLPVESVSWNDAVSFCRALSQKTGSEFRLPTEAEWEYACRAGTTTKYSLGDNASDLARAGWYFSNSSLKTHPVGQKTPNAWGLYDMHGNVWEWCSDWYGNYPSGSVTNPMGAQTGPYRVIRGGGWCNYVYNCRSAVGSATTRASGTAM